MSGHSMTRPWQNRRARFFATTRCPGSRCMATSSVSQSGLGERAPRLALPVGALSEGGRTGEVGYNPQRAASLSQPHHDFPAHRMTTPSREEPLGKLTLLVRLLDRAAKAVP